MQLRLRLKLRCMPCHVKTELTWWALGRVAEGLRGLAEQTAERLARMQLRLQLEITTLRGTIVAWVPPPPGDRLWFAFVTPPQLEAKAEPQASSQLS